MPAPLCYAVAPHWLWTAAGILFMQAAVVNAPAISVYLSIGIPRDRIAVVMTTVLSAYSIGLIISNLAAGWLAQVAPMSALFWASFVFFLLAAICIAFLPSKTQPVRPHKRVFRLFGVVIVTLCPAGSIQPVAASGVLALGAAAIQIVCDIWLTNVTRR